MEPTEEMIQFYEKRTYEHINRVIENMIIMKDYKGLEESILKERAKSHDRSKFDNPERIPYIYLSWWYKCKNEQIYYQYPPDVENKVKQAIEHHKKNNLHHPESHKNVNSMLLIDLVEMVCDWTAMAQEYGNTSCYEYALDNINKWNFSDDKKNEIFSIITELDNRLKLKHI